MRVHRGLIKRKIFLRKTFLLGNNLRWSILAENTIPGSFPNRPFVYFVKHLPIFIRNADGHLTRLLANVIDNSSSIIQLHVIIEETCKQLGVTSYSRWEVHK